MDFQPNCVIECVVLTRHREATKSLGLDVGAAYTQKGVAAIEGGTDVRIDLAYVEFPVLARLTFPTGGRVDSHVSIGPIFAVEASCEAEVTQVELSITLNCDDPLLDGGLMFVLPPEGSTQVVPTRESSVGALEAGQRVRVRAADALSIEGVFLGLEGQDMLLSTTGAGPAQRVPVDRLEALWVRKRATRKGFYSVG